MRASIAIIAAVAGLATATPGYGYGGYEETKPSTTPVYEEYPTSTPVEEYPTSTPVEEYPSYPTETPSETEGYPTYPTSSPVDEYPVYPTETEGYPTYPVSTPVEEYPEYPTETASVPGYPEYPTETPEASTGEGYPPTHETSACLTSTTITVTVPYPESTGVYYTVPTPEAPYPTGTGVYPPAPPAGTASSSGYLKPSATYPAEFTGAASHAKVGGFVAGVGAFAAFFL